jgi:hypothetical protein
MLHKRAHCISAKSLLADGGALPHVEQALDSGSSGRELHL